HHALLLGEAVGRNGRMEALLGEHAERLLHVLVEDLEVGPDVLVARVGVVLPAELAGAPVERALIEPSRALEEHVLGHVGNTRMRAVEARAGAYRERDRRERPGYRIEEHRQRPM